MEKTSVIIPCRNDFQYLPLVIEHYTGGIDPSELEIIICNDGSVFPTGQFRPISPQEFNYSNLKVINTPIARGVGFSFDRMAQEASGDILVISGNDILVRKRSWLSDVKNAVKTYPDALGVAVSIGLDPLRPELPPKKTVRRGADMLIQVDVDDLPLTSKLRELPNYTDLFKGKWRNDNPFPISCAMGAMYFCRRDFFLRAGGWDTDPKERWQGHRIWGSLEPFISLKFWLCGGSVMLFPNIEAGHVFSRIDRRHRYANGGRSEIDIFWNQLWIAETMVHDERLREQVINFLNPLLNLGVAKQRIKQFYNNVLKIRKENEKRFTHDFQWFLDRFGIILK